MRGAVHPLRESGQRLNMLSSTDLVVSCPLLGAFSVPNLLLFWVLYQGLLRFRLVDTILGISTIVGGERG